MFLSRKTRIPFVFFSEDQANAFSDSARRLLTWAGEEYTDCCYKFARECISRIEARSMMPKLCWRSLATAA